MLRIPSTFAVTFSLVLVAAACDPGEPTPPPPSGGSGSGSGGSGSGGSGGGSGGSGSGGSGGSTGTFPAYATTILTRVNQLRSTGADCGGVWYRAAPAVALDSALMNAAQGHSADMAARNYFSHDSLDGRSAWDRIDDAGFAGNGVGENIAAGQSTADEVFEAWVDSPGHCTNLMAASATHMGIGYAHNSATTYETFWTQDFGAR
ncbi:MAG: CAP domain-containing protein [Deltaproteobacteria bacterium]|nr:CAP domain-containing protein [Deltaproteobacteria bacterium]